MKLYYLFLLVMFFLFNSCVEQTPRTKSVAPISVRDTTKRTSRSHLWNSNTSTYKKTKSSYTPSKKNVQEEIFLQNQEVGGIGDDRNILWVF